MPQFIPQILAVMGLERATGADVGVSSTVERTGALDLVGLERESDDYSFSSPQLPNAADEAAKATEDARQAELDKRRKRVRTLLTSQEDLGMATVGQKTLLGG